MKEINDVMEIYDIIKSGSTFTRAELVELTGQPDRQVRKEIRKLRREGFPIMSMPDGGYKLAEDEEEKAELLHQLKGRALDLLRTHSLLVRQLKVDGAQITLAEIAEAMEVANG